jgi:predicted MFS family arabinose efflux permease
MRKLLMVSFLTMFVIGTDTFLVAPLLPTLQRQFQVPDDVAPWMVGAYALGYALFALVAGPWSERWDRKRVMVAGLGAFTLSTLLCGFATGFWTMLLCRGMAGISAAFTSPQVWAGLGALLPRDKVVKGMGIATAGLALSQALGVPIGSFLSTFSWSTPFYAIALLAAVTMMLVYWWLPSQPPASLMPRGGLLRPYRFVFQDTSAILSFSAYFLFQLGNFGRFSVIGLWMHERFDFTVTQLGYVMVVFGVGNLVGSLFGTRLVQRLGETQALLGGLTIVVFISAFIPLLDNPTLVECLWALTAATFGMVFPVMMSTLQSHAPQARSTVAGLANALMYGGTTLGSLTCGELYARVGGFISVSLFSAVCFSVALGVFYSVHASHRKLRNSPETP